MKSRVDLDTQVNSWRDLWAGTTSNQLQDFQVWYHRQAGGHAGPPLEVQYSSSNWHMCSLQWMGVVFHGSCVLLGSWLAALTTELPMEDCTPGGRSHALPPLSHQVWPLWAPESRKHLYPLGMFRSPGACRSPGDWGRWFKGDFTQQFVTAASDLLTAQSFSVSGLLVCRDYENWQ